MKLSIITINYNNGPGLKKTIDSVLSQDFTDFEYIVIDGNSTDDSIDLIKDNQARISYWVSEKDDGIYDAMNKGILRASGDYLLMLNSGDHLIDSHSLKAAFDAIGENHADIVYGNLIWEENGAFANQLFPPKLNFNYFRGHYALGHQATFIRRRIHDIVGLYDLNIKIVADWKFFVMAIYKFNCSTLYINSAISVCPTGGMSYQIDNQLKITKDKNDILKSEFGAFVRDYEEFDKLKNIGMIFLSKFFGIVKDKMRKRIGNYL